MVRGVQFALGTLAAVLAAAVARRWGGPKAGWIAGIVLGAYGPLIHYESMLLAEPIQATLLVLALWFIARPGRRGGGLAGPLPSFAAGLLLGGASALRPTALIVVCVTFVAMMVVPRGSRTGWTARLGPAFALIAGAALAIAPFTVRNLVVSGEPVLLSANGGFNFWVGNNSGSDGTFRPPPGYDFEHDPVGLDLAKQTSSRPLSYVEASGWWATRAIDEIRNDPGHSTGLLVRKLRMLLAPAEVPQLGEDYSWYRQRAWPLGIPLTATMILVPAILLPLVRMFLRRDVSPFHWVASAWVVAYLLTIAAFFVAGRYRIPIMPVAGVAAGIALATIVDHLSRAAMRGRAILAGTIIAACVVVPSAWNAPGREAVPVESPTGVIERQNGILRYDRGDFAGAESLYRISLSIREDPLTRGNLANALKAQGRIDEAESEYRRALDLDPRAAGVWYNLGNLYRDHRKDRPSAIRFYEKAIECQPRFPNPYLTLTLLHAYDGNFEAALRVANQGLERIPDRHQEIRKTLMEVRDRLSAPPKRP